LVDFRYIRQSSHSGFTLLELLVVLAIAGLLMSIVPSMISGAVPGVKLRMESRELAVVLRQSRNRAIARGDTIDVIIDLDSPGYIVENREPHELPAGINVNARKTLALESGTPRSSNGQIPLGKFRLRFYADGSSSGAVITLRRKTLAYTVTVDWLFGSVLMSSGTADDAV
jgi:general secretion pathway protein H